MQPLGPAWVEVDLDALADNVRQIRTSLDPGILCIGVVKGDGYGHGALPVAKTILEEGIQWLGVADLWEAQELRAGGIKEPILVFSPAPDAAAFAVSMDVRMTVCDLSFARALAWAARRKGRLIKVHLKVDCGMGRLGVLPQEAADLAGRILRLEGLELEGIYTHFPQGEKLRPTQRQLDVFVALCRALHQRGIHIPLRHCASSKTLYSLPQSHLEMVRVGTLLYGQGGKGFKETWRLKTRPIFRKVLPPGSGVGYGREYVTKKRTSIGVLPIGYADGVSLEPAPSPRRAWKHILRGLLRPSRPVKGPKESLPLLGRVSMNMTTIGLPPDVDDNLEIQVRRTCINRRLPKVYLQGGRPVFVGFQGAYQSVEQIDDIYYLGRQKVHV